MSSPWLARPSGRQCRCRSKRRTTAPAARTKKRRAGRTACGDRGPHARFAGTMSSLMECVGSAPGVRRAQRMQQRRSETPPLDRIGEWRRGATPGGCQSLQVAGPAARIEEQCARLEFLVPQGGRQLRERGKEVTLGQAPAAGAAVPQARPGAGGSSRRPVSAHRSRCHDTCDLRQAGPRTGEGHPAAVDQQRPAIRPLQGRQDRVARPAAVATGCWIRNWCRESSVPWARTPLVEGDIRGGAPVEVRQHRGAAGEAGPLRHPILPAAPLPEPQAHEHQAGQGGERQRSPRAAAPGCARRRYTAAPAMRSVIWVLVALCLAGILE